jgi:hypothetical protein
LGSRAKSRYFARKTTTIERIDKRLLERLFPEELSDYFEIIDYQILCSLSAKEEYWLIDFEEKNELPEGYSGEEYESKGFMQSSLIQDFPLRGRPVFLRIKKRRWRHKETGAVIRRDFSFIADGSKFTQELSDFLKEAGGYAGRYHEKHSQFLRD